MEEYDAVIIGAGPAGISAGIYLGRAMKKVLVINRNGGRTSHALHINNYFGFDEISGKELIERGIKQARSYGVEIKEAAVKKVINEKKGFKIKTSGEDYLSKYVIVSSGINDIFPEIDNIYEFLGESFFTCFFCDGYRLIGKKVLLIGNGDENAKMALAIKKTYKSKLVISGREISRKYFAILEKEGIKVIEKEARHILGKNGKMKEVVFEDNSRESCDCILSNLGYERNDSFLSGLKLKRSKHGYIETDKNYQSSIKNLFIIGPLNTGPDQVAVAVGQGAVSGMHIINNGFEV